MEAEVGAVMMCGDFGHRTWRRSSLISWTQRDSSCQQRSERREPSRGKARQGSAAFLLAFFWASQVIKCCLTSAQTSNTITVTVMLFEAKGQDEIMKALFFLLILILWIFIYVVINTTDWHKSTPATCLCVIHQRANILRSGRLFLRCSARSYLRYVLHI